MTFEYEAIIEAQIDAVWAAMRERDQIKQWHGWHYDQLDEEIEQIYFTGVTETGHTLTLGNGDVFTLTDLSGRTLLKLTRSPKGANPEWDEYYDDISEGWISFIEQLRFTAERHPGQERQTVFLSHEGSAKSQALRDLVADAKPGTSYSFTAPNGEELAGEVWYGSENQTGLTVTSWGDGLLVATVIPASPAHPEGGQSLILTCYDNGAFATVEKSWKDWWE
jgi:uncharacterized protein YndB with AHSA1/START domain